MMNLCMTERAYFRSKTRPTLSREGKELAKKLRYNVLALLPNLLAMSSIPPSSVATFK